MQFEFDEQTWRPRAGMAMQPVVMVWWYAADAYSRWANGLDWGRKKECELSTHRSPMGIRRRRMRSRTRNVSMREFTVVVESYESEGLPIPDGAAALGQSRFGLRHMSGTIWHWCRDWFSPEFYPTMPTTNAIRLPNIETGTRSERGGSWVGPIELCRPSYRRGRNPEARGRCLGFRCVGDIPS